MDYVIKATCPNRIHPTRFLTGKSGPGWLTTDISAAYRYDDDKFVGHACIAMNNNPPEDGKELVYSPEPVPSDLTLQLEEVVLDNPSTEVEVVKRELSVVSNNITLPPPSMNGRYDLWELHADRKDRKILLCKNCSLVEVTNAASTNYVAGLLNNEDRVLLLAPHYRRPHRSNNSTWWKYVRVTHKEYHWEALTYDPFEIAKERDQEVTATLVRKSDWALYDATEAFLDERLRRYECKLTLAGTIESEGDSLAVEHGETYYNRDDVLALFGVVTSKQEAA